MPSQDPENLDVVRDYLRAIEAGATGPALARFFDPALVQEELPNRLNPSGVRRDLAAVLASAEKGQLVIRDQRYEIRSAVAEGDRVALEIDWSGTLKVPLGKLAAGDVMRARIATFIVLRERRIIEQRSYDCFEPF
jgi:ketosteroid isomerase-like protein